MTRSTRPRWDRAAHPGGRAHARTGRRCPARRGRRRAGARASAPATTNIGPIGAWRSLVAHLLWEQGVVGSNPAAPIGFLNVGTKQGLSVAAPRSSSRRECDKAEVAMARDSSGSGGGALVAASLAVVSAVIYGIVWWMVDRTLGSRTTRTLGYLPEATRCTQVYVSVSWYVCAPRAARRRDGWSKTSISRWMRAPKRCKQRVLGESREARAEKFANCDFLARNSSVSCGIHQRSRPARKVARRRLFRGISRSAVPAPVGTGGNAYHSTGGASHGKT